MHDEDQQLLGRFVASRDEAAFEALVRRHLGLVLGAARRQLAGDHHAAEDVAQQVFTLLARKAERLRSHSCLEAWLHTATRHACQNHIRAAVRRARRELEATVNATPPEQNLLWEQAAPVLDDALQDLDEQDRSLILRRHVSRQSGAEIAAWLGVSEPAARKQLERALGRLRGLLTRRGITMTALTLAGFLEAQGQAAVSADLVARIAGQAVAQTGAVGASVAWSGWLKSAAIAAAVVLLGAAVVLLKHSAVPTDASSTPAQETTTTSAEVGTAVESPNVTASRAAADVREFTLNIMGADTRAPLPHASATFWVGYDERSQQRIDERAWASSGPVRAVWTNDCLRFLAQVECEGYADTWIEWSREQGALLVPESWTFFMEPAPAISGVVLDEQGNPVPSATILVWVQGDLLIPVPGTKQPALSHPARWMNNEITAQSDADGRWAIRRIAGAVQNAGLTVVVEHPQFLTDRSDLKPGNPLPALQAGTYRSVLKRQQIVTVSGRVLDPEGNPLANARVTDGTLFSNPGTTRGGDQHLTTDTNGAFSLAAGSGSQINVTAKADGFAAQTVVWSGKPLSITLRPGRALRLRVVNPAGEPIEGIRVESTQFQHTGGTERNQSTRYELVAVTDAEGRVSWTDVPDEPLLLMFWSDSTDYLTRGGEVVEPAEEEQTVVLRPALKVTGTVTDADTGTAVAAFRVATQDVFGTNGTPTAQPFRLPDTVSGQLFEAGSFALNLKPCGGPIAPSLRGPRELQRQGCYLKFTAPGYAASTTRFLDVNEANVELQIALKRSRNTKVQIVDEQGYAVAGAEVAALSASGTLRLSRGAWAANGDYALTTDANGWFELPADESLRVVVVLDRPRTLMGWDTAESLRNRGRLWLSQLHRLELVTTRAGAAVTPESCDVKLTSPVLRQLTGDSSPLWSRCDAEGKCVFVGLPAGTYNATLLPRKGDVEDGAGREFLVEVATNAPAVVRYELPIAAAQQAEASPTGQRQP